MLPGPDLVARREERWQKVSKMTEADLETRIDPVCGMTVKLGIGKPTHAYNGEDHHFCGQKCHDRFAADPYFYLSGNHRKRQKSAPKAAQYTCPMHPEVISDTFGDCPKCGMALEPVGAPTDDGPNPELKDFTRRFWVSLLLAVPLMVISMGEMVGLPVHHWLSPQASNWLQFALATPVVLWAALDRKSVV